jgi:hypothetical protein
MVDYVAHMKIKKFEGFIKQYKFSAKIIKFCNDY